MGTQVVIIDDVHEEVAAIERAIEIEEGFSCVYGDWSKEDDKKKIIETIQQNPQSIVLLDIFFHGEEKGEYIYRSIKQINSEILVFILSNKFKIK